MNVELQKWLALIVFWASILLAASDGTGWLFLAAVASVILLIPSEPTKPNDDKKRRYRV